MKVEKPDIGIVMRLFQEAHQEEIPSESACKTVVILAGSFLEARQYMHDRYDVNIGQGHVIVDGTTYMYLRDLHSMRGLEKYRVETYGSWYKRDDIEEINFFIGYMKAIGRII